MKVSELRGMVFDHEAQGLGYMVLRKPRKKGSRIKSRVALLPGLIGHCLAEDAAWVTVGLEVADVRAWLSRRGVTC